jgi:hypothetical protein
MKNRVMWIAILALAGGAFAAPLHALHAQDTASKPGGLNKVAHDVSKTMKKAGRDTKAEVKRDASKAHAALTQAGNETKTATGKATGIHKVGGSVGKAGRAVSHTSKKVGANAKHGLKHAKAAAHADLTKAGKDAKEAVKKP